MRQVRFDEIDVGCGQRGVDEIAEQLAGGAASAAARARQHCGGEIVLVHALEKRLRLGQPGIEGLVEETPHGAIRVWSKAGWAAWA